jgi:hypothetical protein
LKQTTRETTPTMNSTINEGSRRAYHTFTNTEFTGVFDSSVYTYDNIYGGNPRIGYGCDYHLFIKYGDKVYMDVKRVGEIVISFTELQKNKYWKYYYDLSLVLTNDKKLVIQDIEYNGDFLKYNNNYLEMEIYNEPRVWSIDTAFIECNINTKAKKIISSDDVCYYKINPYELVNMEYTSQDDLYNFESLYMTQRELRNRKFDETSSIYMDLAIEYRITRGDKK